MKRIIKKIITIITLLFILLPFFSPSYLYANEPVNLYLFHGDGCPHCAKERAFLQIIKNVYEEKVNISKFEVYYNLENTELFNKVTEDLDIDVAGVPLLVIGDEAIIGYDSDLTTGKEIRERIDHCLINSCKDDLNDYLINNKYSPDNIEVLGVSERQVEGDDSADGDKNRENNKDDDNDRSINIPIIGTIDLSSISLPLATFFIALMDGFNPCAMWILIFLITMLINMKDKKRLYTLGSIFIITSGIVYFVFLAAWFNFFKLIGYAYWIKVVIGIVAITTGFLHIRNAIRSQGECHVVDENKRRSIIDRIKNITKEKSYLFAIIGIITLALSVNLIEVVCSAGLPSVYTNLLASSSLNTFTYYSYLLFYTVIFMLDDLIVFFIAVKTFEVTGIAEKYTKLSSIFGGVIIFIIGILLIFKPELLMFG